ncbi:MAG: uracil-DNA glycosylase [Desulfobacterales bacterium]|nr:MAG: uracil-DNA glycosylase [Desulfobacterales bacterium]
MMENGLIDCHRCRHYYVTWDLNFPHGCQAMGFKSRLLPSGEVRSTMQGKDCLLFNPKANGKTEGKLQR